MAEEETYEAYLKRVTAELRKTRRQLQKLEDGMREPIAIIGMSCRYPGGVSSPEDLWKLVAAGTDAISGFPHDRGWDTDVAHDLDRGLSDMRRGGFLYDAAEFDAAFFGISPRETLAMDAQQRLLLEGAWEALEDAEIDPSSLRGSQTGVFVGLMYHDYGTAGVDLGSQPALDALQGYLGTGVLGSVASGRIAYTLGLEGPAVSVDTACSSSLIALHLASQALRAGESTMALIGGVTVMATPSTFTEFICQGGLSSDGRCKSFAESADGVGWSEGMGMLVLERLSDAERNGHRVLALVRGSAINQDGASNGLTAPNGPSQEKVIRQALASAGLTPADVDAVEAHGTGTTLGDPIEARALLEVYGRGRSNGPLYLGSLKSNIGHTQAAAGVGGVIKMVQAMHHEVLPRTLHVDAPTSHVDWSAGEVRLLTQERSWEKNGEPRRVGVSSFGVSGTNAHVILEEAPPPGLIASAGGAGVGLLGAGVSPWALSGRSASALCGQADRLRQHVGADPGLGIGDVGFSLSTRPAFSHRAVVLGRGREQLLGGLAAVAVAEASADVVEGVAGRTGQGVVLVFPGQGTQWDGMALELLDCSRVFAERLGACGEALSAHVGWSVEDVLRGADGAPGLDRVDVVQPVLFAVMVSLAGLWEACGVRPAIVVGHSQGEIAAACVAGGLSLEDAARVVAVRSRALVGLAGRGGMVSVALPVRELGRRIERWGNRVGVAAVNGPSSVVVSGERDALAELLGECRDDGVRAREIPVDYAAHSVAVQEIREELLEGCAGITPRSGEIPFFSTVTGGLLDTSELDGEYWYRNLRETVQFEQASRALLAGGHRAFLEVSPHPVLTVGVQEAVAGALEEPGDAVVVGSLRREQDDPERFLRSLSELWVRGVEVDWGAVFRGSSAKRVKLPTYAFQRERYWLNGSLGASDMAFAGQARSDHPLLSAAVALADDRGWVFTGRLSLASHPWLADHAVMGSVLFPGTALLELALHVGGQLDCGVVSELTLESPLPLPDGSAVQLQVSVGEPDDAGARSLGIHSRPEQGSVEDELGEQQWTRHASGVLGPAGAAVNPRAASVQERAALLSDDSWPPPGAQALPVDGLYDLLAERGFEYGPVFQGLRAAWRHGDDLFAEVALSREQQHEAHSFGVHPALLDSAFHLALSPPANGQASSEDQRDRGVRLPFSFNGVELYAAGASSLRVCLTSLGDDAVSLVVADEAGGLVASIDSLLVREPSTAQLDAARGARQDSLFGLHWREVQPSPQSPEHSMVILDAGDSPLARCLSAAGHSVETRPSLRSLSEALDGGAPVPEIVVLDCQADEVDQADQWLLSARENAHRVLAALQDWLADERFSISRLVLVTRGAVGVRAGEHLPGLIQSPVCGLVRSAQSESPGRVQLIDVDSDQASWHALPGAMQADEPQLAVREGTILAPRLARAGSAGALSVPEGVLEWRLGAGAGGTLEELALVPAPETAQPLERGQARVGMRAGGLNFRDVLIALGMYPGEASVGGEGAGVVLEVGPGVEGLAVGDRVMGLFSGLGPVSVTDHHLVARAPQGWSFAQAASVPIAFLTAYYGLVDLAGLQSGERVLVHAAAGGVGMAAVQLARHLGAEVFATASPPKWETLRSMGLDQGHIASSRTPEFKQRFLEETGGRGMDVVLDSLAGELVDASLELLPNGGRFIEMGRTDIRDPTGIAEKYRGTTYQAFDLMEAGPDRIQEMLAELLALFDAGVLEPLPITAWDIRHAPQAFRYMSQARHVGKNILTLPAPIDPQETVLITGGTGTLGGLLARHLVSEHSVGQLLLASRRGLGAEGATELKRELEALGAEITIAACDVSQRDQLETLLESISPEHPLSGVVHVAGVRDDGVIGSLTPERLDLVLAAKADAACHLHELTAHMDLKMFVLFSSASATFGSPGQGNYAAANAFLDALAAERRARGLSGTALAWGLWEQASEMTGDLDKADHSRLARSGMRALSSEHGLALFDEALDTGEALMLPIPLDLKALRTQARTGALPALLGDLVRVPAARRADQRSASLARRLASTPEAEREGVVLELVRGQVATVLGHLNPQTIDTKRAFKELGFDSLTAVELRNRLSTQTGLRLPATLIFDHPTTSAVVSHLLAELSDTSSRIAKPLAMARALDEPLAIVGMSCRYPGGANSPEELWELVASGTDAISPFPADRGWDLERLYDPDPDHPGTSYARTGGFIDDVGEFDAQFFGISPREALAMDPQQRLLLESAWEALEDASIDPALLKGSQTGVFTGIIASHYGVSRSGSMSGDLGGYGLTSATSVASGRIAYMFGLEGPAVSVDTACSSSLVALHLAGQALRSGECSLALAGGVTVVVSPGIFVESSRQRGLASDGRCKAFGDTADGAGFSDGVGMLVVERLSDAVRNGHQVLAVVRGSAVNQDGASNGLTAPHGPSQRRVIVQALANARLSPTQVDVVEAHGTGTTLGDPIEAQALIATYGQARPEERPLWLGSVKSNIGHTSAAAGVAGVIKMVMAMRHGVLPRTLHVDRPSSHVDWSAGEVRLLTHEREWKKDGEPRRAGVSSFGVSGTNAHVILEEATAVERVSGAEGLNGANIEVEDPIGVIKWADDDSGASRIVLRNRVVPWVLSGKSGPALCAQAARLRAFVDGSSGPAMEDVGVSLTGRSVFGDRAVVLGGGREEALVGLSAIARDQPAANVVKGRVLASGSGAVFVFPGQGSQWVGMAVGLLECSGVFAECLGACEEALSEFVDWSVVDVLCGVEGVPGLDRVDVVQPVLFAVMVSLAGLWEACGVRPRAVVGHSQGEIAAAYVAGGLSLGDAARVVALRSRALVSLAGRGGMVSVALPVGQLEGRLRRWEGRVVVAAVNGPTSVVVSGERGALAEFLEYCEADGVRAREIPVDYAAHSIDVQEIREELLEGCAGIEPCSSEIPFFSTVTGGLLDTSELDGEYWYRNLREPVLFEEATRVLLEGRHATFLEVSPHPVLTVGVQETVDEALPDPGDAVVVGTLRRDEGGPERFLRSVSELWVRGVDVDWQALLQGAGAKRVKLPTYAFQRERYWLELGAGTGDVGSIGQSSADHPLLGAVVELAGGEGWLFTGRISLESHPWLADHAVMGNVLLPGTALVDLALCVGERVQCSGVRELTLEAPLVFSNGSAVRLQVSAGEPDEDGARSLSIHSRPEHDMAEGEWTRHASGVLGLAGAAVDAHAVSIQEAARMLGDGVWPPQGSEVIPVDGLYELLADRGFDYGPAFQRLRAAWRRGDELFAEVALSAEQQDEAHAFGMHPALLDSAFHVALSPRASGNATGEDQESGGVRLPFSFNSVELYAAGASSLRVCLCPIGNDAISLVAADEAGGLVASVGSLVAREVSAAQLDAAQGAHHDSLFRLDWNETPFVAQAPMDRIALLGAGGSSLADSLNGAGHSAETYTDLAALREALVDGVSPPDVVILDCQPGQPGQLGRTDRVDGVDGSGGIGQVEPGGLVLVHESAHRVLGVLQGWLADERFVDSRLVLLTRGAVGVGGGEGLPGLVQSPVWGLVRSAQSEAPDRFLLIDIDNDRASWNALASALGAGEPQIALRKGTTLVPRLARAGLEGRSELSRGEAARASVDPPVLDPLGTVLITGGTGTLGGLLARHLVVEHGVSHLLLASRRGEAAEGARELQAELESLGAEVTIAACDVCERDQLKALLDSIPEQHPLNGVVHAAVRLDDGVIGSLTPERLDHVLAVKADAAWHLHELTAHMSLSMFVLFSSAAAQFGSPGQGNYAAANAFLDGLAADRRARGLPGISLAWGLWEAVSGMTARLSETDRSRMSRSGMRALASEDGLTLFDRALGAQEALLLPIHLDLAAVRAQARTGALPALFSRLVHVPARGLRQQSASLARRLASTPEHEREGIVLELVRAQVATVLGHAFPRAIDTRRTFKELGFDSLIAVDLRNRLNTQTGLRLAATLIFDHPTPQAVTAYILEQVADDGEQIAPEQGETAVRRALASIPLVRLRQAGLIGTLMELADDDAAGLDENGDIDQIDTLDVVDLVRRTLGSHSADLERRDS